MSSTSFLTNNGLTLINKAYWEGTTLTVVLLKDSYVPNKDHDFLNDIAGDEVDATGYVRTVLAGKAATLDNTFDWLSYTATNTGFGALGGAVNNTISYAAIVEIKGGPSTADPVVAIIKKNDVTTPAAYTVVWNNPILRAAMG